MIKDIREKIIPDFKPQTIEIEQVELGDLRPETIQDKAKPPTRSPITVVDPVKEA